MTGPVFMSEWTAFAIGITLGICIGVSGVGIVLMAREENELLSWAISCGANISGSKKAFRYFGRHRTSMITQIELILLGIKDDRSVPTYQKLMQAIYAIGRLPDSLNRLNSASKLFGSNGVYLIPLIDSTRVRRQHG